MTADTKINIKDNIFMMRDVRREGYMMRDGEREMYIMRDGEREMRVVLMLEACALPAYCCSGLLVCAWRLLAEHAPAI